METFQRNVQYHSLLNAVKLMLNAIELLQLFYLKFIICKFKLAVFRHALLNVSTFTFSTGTVEHFAPRQSCHDLSQKTQLKNPHVTYV